MPVSQRLDFLSNMSHDIRTPMNAILGYAQLMVNELKGKNLPEISEYLKNYNSQEIFFCQS